MGFYRVKKQQECLSVHSSNASQMGPARGLAWDDVLAAQWLLAGTPARSDSGPACKRGWCSGVTLCLEGTGVFIPPGQRQWDFGVWGAPSCSVSRGFVLRMCGHGEQVATSQAMMLLRVSSQVNGPVLPMQSVKRRREALLLKPFREKI